MEKLTLTFGILPTEDQFDDGWDAAFAESAGNTFRFGNDKRVGSCELTRSELWTELQKATDEHNENGDDEAGYWASNVLGHLGIEWV